MAPCGVTDETKTKAVAATLFRVCIAFHLHSNSSETATRKSMSEGCYE